MRKLSVRAFEWIRKDLNLIVLSKASAIHILKTSTAIFWIFNRCHLPRQRHICEKFIQKSNHPLCGYFSIRRKSNQLQSLVIEWCQKRKSISLWHLWRQRNRRNTFLWCKIKHRWKRSKGKRATKKKSRRKASQRTYFALQEKWTRNNIIFITSFSFIN
jgi:hypothetical protein